MLRRNVLLLARIALQVGDLAEAQKETQSALARLSHLQAPVLAYQAQFLLGQIAQGRGDRKTAFAAFQEARKTLETLRSHLRGDELKISFVKNRLQVYGALLALYLSAPDGEISPTEAFGWMEAAKSRSMSELIFQSGQSLPMGDSGQSELVRRIRDLREELNWYYHRIELEQLRPEEMSRDRLQQLQQQAHSREHDLLRTLRELPAHERENATLEAAGEFSLEKVQAGLPRSAALVEYFTVGERVVAAVLTRSAVEIHPVTVLSRVTHILNLLRFQLSKFRMGKAYLQQFEGPFSGPRRAIWNRSMRNSSPRSARSYPGSI